MPIWQNILSQTFTSNIEMISKTTPILNHSPNKNKNKDIFTKLSTIYPSNMKYEVNSDIIEYLNITDDVTNISTHNAECGRIWLYHEKGLILSINSITNNAVYIKNISPYRSNCNASRITVYITIEGIELLGGLAIPHPIKCEWYYTFNIIISGEYKIMARLLHYDGHLDAHYTKCNVSDNTLLYNEMTTIIDSNGVYYDDRFIFKRITSEMKLYWEHEQCCEWCSRLENCVYFISDDVFNEKYKNKQMQQNRCIMFNETAINTMKTITVSEMSNKFDNFNTTNWIFGYNRKEKTKYYLGSLMASTPTIQIKCTHNFQRQIREYDLIYNSGKYITLNSNLKNKSVTENKPFCSFDNIQNFHGRWIVINMDDRPRFLGKPKWYENEQCKIDDFYCNVPAFFAPYHCQWRYNNTLQILKDLYAIKRIKKITFCGDSVMTNTVKFLKVLFQKELFDCNVDNVDVINNSLQSPLLCFIGTNNVKKYFEDNIWNKWMDDKKRRLNKVRNGKEEVFVSNFRIVHKLWHNTIDDIKEYINEIGVGYNNYFQSEYGDDINNWPMRIAFELPLIISEREYHCTAPRSIMVNQLINTILRDKWGWNVFPLFKLTQAMQYYYTDINDGLHSNGFVGSDRIRVLFELIFNSLY